MSKGEEKIASILTQAGYKFVREKVFPDLRNGKLRFDFYLPSQKILIENDGRQHFEQIKKFQPTKADFMHAKQNDYYKNSYALSHHLKLYRIPFWELDSIQSVDNIFSSSHLVQNKWHNDIIYRQYLSSGGREGGSIVK